MAAESFVYKVVALTVFVLIAATVLVPVVQDAQNQQVSVAQNADILYNYDAGASVPDIKLEINNSTKSYLINDEVVYSNINDYSLLLVADSMVIRYLAPANTSYCTFDVSPYNATNAYVKLVVTSGSAVLTLGTTDYNLGAISFLLYPDKDGSYGMIRATQEINLTKGATAYLVTPSDNPPTGNDYRKPMSVSTYNSTDGIQTIFSQTATTTAPAWVDTTTFDIGSNVTDSDRVHETISFGPAEYTISDESGEIVTAGISVICPLEYKYISSDDSMMISLLDIIPLMVFIAAIMIAVAMLKGKS